MDILFIIGLTIFAGTLAGKIFQKFKMPQVTGYIVAGLLVGQSGLKLWSPEVMEFMSPVVNLALGIIGFMLGSELKLDLFRRRGKSIYSILFSQAIFTFLLVTGLVTLITGKLYIGLLLGAIATATDPAATVDVLWETKAKGPLTATLLAIVALDDLLALFIYAFAGLLAKSLLLQNELSFHLLIDVVIEIGTGVAIGIIGGILLYWLIHFIRDRERILPFSVGAIAIIVGLSSYFKIDLILASMLSGITLANIAPLKSEEIFSEIKRFSVPIYVVFFVLVGAQLDVATVLGTGATLLLIIYFLGRSLGKYLGSFVGGVIGKAQPNVTRYLGWGLFSQAGVAIGMAISTNNNLSHLGPQASEIGIMIVNIAVATTVVFQLVGPLLVRWAAQRSDEIGRNVTEEDVIESYKISDLIEREVPVIKENTPLYTMVDIVKKSESDHFCVVDDQNKLLGTIYVGDLRDILLQQEEELDRLVLARDVAVPTMHVITADQPLKEAIRVLRRRALDFLPVVKNEKTKELAGLIHYRIVMAKINKELLSRQDGIE